MTADAFFRMTIQDVFAIRGQGVVVTGQIEAGTLSLHDVIKVSRPGAGSRRVVVAGIEIAHKQVLQAQAGDQVGVLLRERENQDFKKGDTLLGA